MLIALIATVWILLAAFFVLLCRAAGADHDVAATDERSGLETAPAPRRVAERSAPRLQPLKVRSTGVSGTALRPAHSARVRDSH
jgi:hypothetical protein